VACAVRRQAGGLGDAAVAAGHVRDAAADEVAVDDVVVHDQGRMEELESRPELGRIVEVTATEHLVGGHHQAGAEAFAACGAALEGLPQRVVARTDLRGPVLGLLEEPPEGVLHLLQPCGLDQQSVHVHR